MSFQSHGNLEEKCEKKIEHFVASRTCIYSIFESHVIQTSLTSQSQIKRGTLIKQDRETTKYNFFFAIAMC